jgi:hypothetical protein
MPYVYHKNVSTGDIHIAPDKIYADQTARLAATFITADIDKLLKQTSDGSFWRVTAAGAPGTSVPFTPPVPVVGDIDKAPFVVSDGASGVKFAYEAASKKAPSITEVFDMADFPTPSGGVITLPTGKYLIKANLVTADRFAIGAGSTVTIQTDDSRGNSLTYVGTGTLFTATNAANFILQEFQVILAGNGATLFDITGGVFRWFGGAGIFVGTGQSIGTATTPIVSVIDTVAFFGFEEGFTSDSPFISYFRELSLEPSAIGSGTALTLDDGTGAFATFDDITATLTASQSLIDIKPCIGTRVSIRDVKKSPTGAFFKAGTTGPITSFTDTSTPNTAVSVTNDGGDALFTSVGHGLNVGELPIHTTFPESSYNTSTSVVTEVPSADTYKIGIAYVSDSSGLFSTTTCQIDDVAHGLANGCCVSIFGTINFGGGYKIFNVQTDTFEITLGKAFPGSESTGNWDTSSLDETSAFVVATDNGDQKDSANIGSFVVGGNATPTTINTKDVFENLNLGGNAVAASDIELWTLTNATTGEIRYDGISPAPVSYTGTLSAISSGGPQRFDFQLLENGSPLAAPDNVDIPIEVSTTLRASPLQWSVIAHPGDLFRMQVANRDGTSNITIDTLKVSVK